MKNLPSVRAFCAGIAASVSTCFLSGCLLTTDPTLGPNDSIAHVRFRFIGDGEDRLLQYVPADCQFATDRAIRLLASIDYQSHTLNLNAAMNPPTKLGMPNDLGDVSKLTYGEAVVKADTPLQFGSEWYWGDGFRLFKADGFARFTPEANANYEVTTTVAPHTRLTMTIEKIEVVDGHITRAPVAWKIIPHCAG